MRRRLLTNNKKIQGYLPSEAPPCSVVFVNKEDLSFAIDDKWSLAKYPAELWEPIGVVVIPANHGVLKDGTGTENQCGIMSLNSMNYNIPEQGSSIEQDGNTIKFGGFGTNIANKSDGLERYDSIANGLINYNKFACGEYPTNKSTQLTDSYETIMATQKVVGANATWNGQLSGNLCSPSPYVGDDRKSGDYNTNYGTTAFDKSSNRNVLADFKGIINTKIITDLATAQSDWKTANTIINNSDKGYYPAACCCARYKTIGTKAFVDCSIKQLRHGTRFWYMPAMGEAGYFLARMADLRDVVSKLNVAYDVGRIFGNTPAIPSSSENDEGYAFLVQTAISKSGVYSKSANNSIRAFLRLGDSDFEPDTLNTNGYDYVDMGEAGIWATCNIGADKPEDYGLYFAWGETVGYANPADKPMGFQWVSTKYCEDGTGSILSKYITTNRYGKIDNKTTLDLEDDAAHVIMGGNWKIPSPNDFEKLSNACDIIRDNKTFYTKFVLKTDPTKQLIFPPNGAVTGRVFMDDVGVSTVLLTNSINPIYNESILNFIINDYGNYINDENPRYMGFGIRAILKPE